MPIVFSVLFALPAMQFPSPDVLQVLAALNGTLLVDGLSMAGCASCDEEPPDNKDYNCYKSCRPGEDCVLPNMNSLVCFCLRYQCAFSVSACSLNGTCGPPSTPVRLFNSTLSCDERYLGGVAPDCILNNQANDSECYFISENCVVSQRTSFTATLPTFSSDDDDERDSKSSGIGSQNSTITLAIAIPLAIGALMLLAVMAAVGNRSRYVL